MCNVLVKKAFQGNAYMKKTSDAGDIITAIFLDFLPNFRLRTRHQYCTTGNGQRVVAYTGWFFSLVPPDFSTKKKTANQPIRAAVLINPFTKKGHDWLLGGFSFWYWNWGVPVKKTTLYNYDIAMIYIYIYWQYNIIIWCWYDIYIAMMYMLCICCYDIAMIYILAI